jgi:PAP2 superfamily
MDLTSRAAGSSRRIVMRSSWMLGGLALVLCQTAGAAEPLSASQRNVEQAGGVVRWAIPATALLATWLIDPVRGGGAADDAQARSNLDLLHLGGSPRHDLALALGRTWLLTGALKISVDETRPDGGAHSFPSGHTSMAFAGAEFLRKQYGWRWGAPAYVAASFVGWSRVEARRHYTQDVLAGALIGMLANHDWQEWQTPAGKVRLASAPVLTGRQAAPGLQLTLLY